MNPHKHDHRNAIGEGKFTEELFDIACKEVGRVLRQASINEDCAGTDRYEKNKKIDVKSRKNRMPTHTCWIELAAAGGSIGSGWGYKDKWIAQLMVYEKDHKLVKPVFGEYHTSDLIELIESKVDLKSNISYAALYKCYTRWTDGEHRGTMTVISYDDLKSFKSFSELEIPRYKWNEVREQYNLLDVLH